MWLPLSAAWKVASCTESVTTEHIVSPGWPQRRCKIPSESYSGAMLRIAARTTSDAEVDSTELLALLSQRLQSTLHCPQKEEW